MVEKVTAIFVSIMAGGKKDTSMWKRGIGLYLSGVFASAIIAGLTLFVIPAINRSQKESRLVNDTEEWPAIFEKNRTEMEMLEDYYNRIENWDFSCVYFWAERKHMYKCYSGDLDRKYVTDEDYVPKEFLEFSLKSGDFPKDGCRVILQGDYWKSPKFSLNISLADISPDSRILIVDTFRYGKKEFYYLYSPNGFPAVEKREYESLVIKSLGNGWYSIIAEQGGELQY